MTASHLLIRELNRRQSVNFLSYHLHVHGPLLSMFLHYNYSQTRLAFVRLNTKWHEESLPLTPAWRFT